MVSISARDSFRSELRERLKRVNKERVWIMEEEAFVSVANVEITPSV
jgi:hypothetical protein